MISCKNQPINEEGAMDLWPEENYEIVKHLVTFMGYSTKGVSIPFVGRKKRL